MDDNHIVCRKIQFSDVQAVAKLHLQWLNTSFTGKPGLKLLEIYYQQIVREQGAVGYVADVRGAVAGYVCGVWDTSHVKRNLLFHGNGKLAFWSLVHVFSHGFLKTISKRIFQPSTDFQLAGYELRPLVVSPAYQGSGVARQLINQLIQDALYRNYSTIFLKTGKNNLRAQAFYTKYGFERVDASDDFFYYQLKLERNE